MGMRRWCNCYVGGDPRTAIGTVRRYVPYAMAHAKKLGKLVKRQEYFNMQYQFTKTPKCQGGQSQAPLQQWLVYDVERPLGIKTRGL
jgi:hypothetical protein